jgi:hypothetical protein
MAGLPNSGYGLRDVGIPPFTWPSSLTTDQWGVSYPTADIVAVWKGTNLTNLSSGSGSFEERAEDEWEAMVTGNTGEVFAVPSVLPDGYTRNLFEDYTSLVGVTGAGAPRRGADCTRLLTADGFVTSLWLPSVNPYGASGTGAGGIIANGAVDYGSFDTASIGFRKLQMRLTVWSTSSPASSFTGTMTVVVSHNADGTNPGVANGDTVDSTTDVAPADLSTAIGSSGGATRWATDWYDLGEILPDLGVPTDFQSQIDLTALTASTSASPGWAAEFRMSPSVEVPLPNYVTGLYDLVAPGGYVP